MNHLEIRQGLAAPNRPKCSAQVLKWIGFACLCLQSFSIAVVQRGIIHMDQHTLQSLYDVMKPGGTMMGWASLAAVCSMLSAAALPIYSWLTYEGWQKTANQWRYLGRLLLLALLSEIPYDLAMSGRLVDMTAQNPVWVLALGVVMLSMFRQVKSRVLCLFIGFAAILWGILLYGYMAPLLLGVMAVFYLFRQKKGLSMVLSAVISLLQFPAPFGLFFVHWYDGTQGHHPKRLFYALYPAQLLVFWLVGCLVA